MKTHCTGASVAEEIANQQPVARDVDAVAAAVRPELRIEVAHRIRLGRSAVAIAHVIQESRRRGRSGATRATSALRRHRSRTGPR
jgi:hypothetical protein